MDRTVWSRLLFNLQLSLGHVPDQTLKHKQEVLDILIRERQEVAASMDRLYQLYQDGQISGPGFGTRYKPLEDRLAQLDEEIPRLQAEIDFMKISFLSQDELLANAQNLYARWPSLDPVEKRKVAETIINRITIGNGEINIDLCQLASPGPPKDVVNGQQIDRDFWAGWGSWREGDWFGGRVLGLLMEGEGAVPCAHRIVEMASSRLWSRR